ncbi:hypothetical protein N8222_08240, partial [Oceanospirillaceae bacterium]|nr:hypothetical protein [Oceanospirillaceae bacterium]
MTFNNTASSFFTLIALAWLIGFASIAPASDMSTWSAKTMCRLIEEKHSSLSTQLLQEKKTRRLICNNGKVMGYASPKVDSSEPTTNTESSEENDYICLSCGTGSTSSTPTDPTDVCPINVIRCADKYVCKIAAPILSNGKRAWLPNYLLAYNFVIEAKRRGLSCGVVSINSTTKTTLTCPANMKACASSFICNKATQKIGGKWSWYSSNSAFYKYTVEAKNRGLSCGVVSSSSTTKTSTTKTSPTCPENLNVCTNDLVCSRGSRLINGKKSWHLGSHGFYKYTVEAKNRGLSCGVVSTSSTTKTTLTCPANMKACASSFICNKATQKIGGKWSWYSSNSAFYKYTVEAKNRGLSCGTISTSAEPKSVSNLLNCPSNKEVRWHNCFGTITFANGSKYVGEWKDDTRTGQGTFTYSPNGEWAGHKYVGEWKDDKRTGQGTYTWPDGDKYVGQWKDSKRTGQGTHTQATGDKYVGEYKDGKRTGQGTFTYSPNGEWAGHKYVGEWKDGVYNGQGTYTYADGQKFVGKWKDGQRAEGTLTYEDGTVEDGIWKDDEFYYGDQTSIKTAVKIAANKDSFSGWIVFWFAVASGLIFIKLRASNRKKQEFI